MRKIDLLSTDLVIVLFIFIALCAGIGLIRMPEFAKHGIMNDITSHERRIITLENTYSQMKQRYDKLLWENLNFFQKRYYKKHKTEYKKYKKSYGSI